MLSPEEVRDAEFRLQVTGGLDGDVVAQLFKTLRAREVVIRMLEDDIEELNDRLFLATWEVPAEWMDLPDA